MSGPLPLSSQAAAAAVLYNANLKELASIDSLIGGAIATAICGGTDPDAGGAISALVTRRLVLQAQIKNLPAQIVGRGGATPLAPGAPPNNPCTAPYPNGLI